MGGPRRSATRHAYHARDCDNRLGGVAFGLERGLPEADGAGPTILLRSRCLFGRHAGCDIRLENLRVSGEHASLRWVGDRWELRDLDSRNGTFVDGRRLGAGERAVLAPGASFSLGGEDTFRLEDASPPVPSASNAKSGLLRTAAEGLLVLPSDDHPEVSIFEDPGGHWVAEEGDATRRVADRDIVIADGEGWILDLPSAAGATWEASAMLPTLETISIRFAVNRDEEHIEVTMIHDGESTSLAARTHHYLLLTLHAPCWRTRRPPRPSGAGSNREVLCRMLATDPRKLNVDVFRVRKQLADLGIHGAAGIIARRPGTGQLRLGIHRVEVTKL